MPVLPAFVKDMESWSSDCQSCLLSGHHQSASPIICSVEEASACNLYRCINVSIVEPSISQQSSFTISDGEHTLLNACKPINTRSCRGPSCFETC